MALLKYVNLLDLKNFASKYYNDLSSDKQFCGKKGNLTEGDRLAISYIKASIAVLNGMGYEIKDFSIDLQEDSFETIED
jgi:hypothetical protein